MCILFNSFSLIQIWIFFIGVSRFSIDVVLFTFKNLNYDIQVFVHLLNRGFLMCNLILVRVVFIDLVLSERCKFLSGFDSASLFVFEFLLVCGFLLLLFLFQFELGFLLFADCINGACVEIGRNAEPSQFSDEVVLDSGFTEIQVVILHYIDLISGVLKQEHECCDIQKVFLCPDCIIGVQKSLNTFKILFVSLIKRLCSSPSLQLVE